MNEYNNMPLEQARDAIIRKLINKDSDFDSTLEGKRAELAEEEQRLVVARADGDASENTALETAIKNVRRIHGEIDSLMVLKGRLDDIKECSYLKGKYDYQAIIDILEDAKMNPNDYVIATDLLSILQDRNNLYDSLYNIKASAVKELETKYSQPGIKDNMSRRDKELFTYLESLYNISKLRKYKPTGICLEYSTIRVLVNDGTSEFVFTGFICPEGISFVEDGIIAANSQLAKLLIGSSINTNKVFTNGNITYTLLGLY